MWAKRGTVPGAEAADRDGPAETCADDDIGCDTGPDADADADADGAAAVADPGVDGDAAPSGVEAAPPDEVAARPRWVLVHPAARIRQQTSAAPVRDLWARLVRDVRALPVRDVR